MENGDEGKAREDASPPPPEFPLYSQAGKAENRLYASEEPFQVRLIKLATSEVIDRPPRANQRRMGIGHGAPSHIPCVRHLPRAMHAAYVVRGAGVMGGVESKRPAALRFIRDTQAASLLFPTG